MTLRSVTRLVQIGVIAEDRHGRKIEDLTRENFRIFDNGKLRDIQLFTRDRTETGPASPLPVEAATSERVFTNVGETRSGPTGVTVILLDSLNATRTDQARAVRGVVRFLSQVHPNDYIAIYSIGPDGLRVLYDFTTDASELVNRMAAWKGDLAHSQYSSVSFQLERILGHPPRQTPVDREAVPRPCLSNSTSSQCTLRTLEVLADRLAGIPGRKNVIWISNGFPMVAASKLNAIALEQAHSRNSVFFRSLDPRSSAGSNVYDTMDGTESFMPETDRTLYKLDGANIALYPIDAIGLETGGEQGTTSQTVSHDASQQSMEVLAKRTGGRAFINDNDILSAIRTSVDDTRVTYTLGFYPDTKLDGAFHAIQVKVVDHPGVTLRYRRGYIDSPDAPTDLSTRKRELEQAAWSPLDANGVPITARLLLSGKPGTHRLSLTIGAAAISLQPENQVWSGEFDVELLQRDQRGAEYNRVNETITLRLKEATYQRVLNTGLPYQREIALNPKASLLRVVVRDAGSGNLGAISIPAQSFEQ